MAPAKTNHVSAPPFHSPAIGSYVECAVLVDRDGLGPKYNLSSKRGMSQGEILILSTYDVGIESTDVVKQISSNRHISGRTEISELRRAWDSGYDNVLN
jgi:hypothetical protein